MGFKETIRVTREFTCCRCASVTLASGVTEKLRTNEYSPGSVYPPVENPDGWGNVVARIYGEKLQSAGGDCCPACIELFKEAVASVFDWTTEKE